MMRLPPRFILFAQSALLLALLAACAQGSSNQALSNGEKISKLEKLRRTQRFCFKNALPCVLLLSEEGSVGCAQCGASTTTAPVEEFDTDDSYKTFLQSRDVQKRVLLVSETLFFKAEGVLKELVNFRENVLAVIVYEERDFETPKKGEQRGPFPWPPPGGYSGDIKYPNTKYNHRLKKDLEGSRPQNVKTTGFQFVSFPFNIFFISSEEAKLIRTGMERFPSKANTNPTSPRFKVESRGRMAACPTVEPKLSNSSFERNAEESLEMVTSADCLKDATCRPVGGFSVWSSLDYINGSNAAGKLPVVAVTAPMDSTALFHALAYGAAAEIASLASLMAVVKSVADYRRSERGRGKDMKRRPMYFAFNAQSWGYTGSSRFLDDIKNVKCKDPNPKLGVCNDPYLNNMKFKALKDVNFSVINLGGLVSPTGVDEQVDYKFYLHGFRKGNKNNSGGAVEKALSDSFNKTSPDPLSISDGFREGSAMDASQSFESFMPYSDVMTVTNFQKNFTNIYYHSPFDNASFIQAATRKPLYAAAAAVAQAVIDLSFGDRVRVPEEPKLINSFIDCLTTNWMEKNCSLAKEYLGEDYDKNYEDIFKNVVRSNFAGVFVPLGHLHKYNPSGYGKALFLQRFMAYHNRLEPVSTKTIISCNMTIQCNETLQVGENKNNLNAEDFRTAFCANRTCVVAESHLHAAFGTGLIPDYYARSNYTVVLPTQSPPPQNPNPGEEKTPLPEPNVPAWAESNWEMSLGMCYLIEDTPIFGAVILISGLGTFSACLIAVWAFKRSVMRTHEETVDGPLPLDRSQLMAG